MFQGVWFNLAASEPPTMHLVFQRCWCLISVSSSRSLVLCFKFYIVFNIFQHWRALSVFDAPPFSRSSRVKPRTQSNVSPLRSVCRTSAKALSSSLLIGHRSTSLRRSQNVDVFFHVAVDSDVDFIKCKYVIIICFVFFQALELEWMRHYLFYDIKDTLFNTNTKYWTVCHNQVEPSVISPAWWELFHPLRTLVFFHICAISYPFPRSSLKFLASGISFFSSWFVFVAISIGNTQHTTHNDNETTTKRQRVA